MLVQALDINLLEEGAQRLIKANEGLFLSHGELITSTYLDCQPSPLSLPPLPLKHVLIGSIGAASP